MATRKIEKAQWRDFMDRLTHELVGRQAEVEVASLGLGARVEAEWLSLFGFNYDPRADVIEVALDGIDHMIYQPREVWAEIGVPGLAALEIVGPDDTKHIVRLREPVLLGVPERARAEGS